MNVATKFDAPRVAILKDDDRLRLIGTPRVLIAYARGEAKVSVDRCPWGWGDVTRVFLNAASPGVLRYANKLFGRLIEEADAQAAYKSRTRLHNAIGRDLRRLAGRVGGR